MGYLANETRKKKGVDLENVCSFCYLSLYNYSNIQLEIKSYKNPSAFHPCFFLPLSAGCVTCKYVRWFRDACDT